jgi:hypothetical protein
VVAPAIQVSAQHEIGAVMNRRTLAFGLVAASLLPGTLAAGAADPAPAPAFPRAQCTHRLVDPAGDGYVNPRGVGVNQVKADGLDIVGAVFRVTPTDVQAFVQVKDIPEPSGMQAYNSAFRYTVSFKYADKAFSFWIGQANPNVDPNGSNALAAKTVGMQPIVTGTHGGVDPAKDYAWISIPRGAFEDKAGMPLADTEKLTGIVIQSGNALAANQFDPADDLTPAAAAAVWPVGDDYCFGPPPGTLSEVATPAAQYGDVSAFTAKLADETGAAVAGAPVSFTVTSAAGTAVGTVVTGTTDAAGVATAPFTAAVPAGTYTVNVLFPGNADVGKAKASSELVVTVEKTKFLTLVVTKPSATTRTVTATLVDDDNKPVAGQRIDWYVNGKKATTLTTDKAGKTQLKTAKPAQTVHAKFVAVAGKYAAATSASRKV